jgi:hypothetical protein
VRAGGRGMACFLSGGVGAAGERHTCIGSSRSRVGRTATQTGGKARADCTVLGQGVCMDTTSRAGLFTSRLLLLLLLPPCR